MKCQHCGNLPASGVWKVTTLESVFAMCLCAACGMAGIGNRVRMRLVKRSRGREEAIFFHDVTRVDLIQSFTRPDTPLQPGGLKPDTPDVQLAPTQRRLNP